VDILDENGNYKKTYDYLLEMSKVYKEIQEEDKKFGTNRAVALIEELAGKNRSNIISAILSNPDILEQVKSTSENSAGSALREQEIQLESIEGRMATFKAQAEEFWTSFIDTDVVKGAISFGTDVLDVVTKLTKAVPSLTTAFSGLVALMSTKGGFGLLNYNRNAQGGFRKRFSSPIIDMFRTPTLSTGTTNALGKLGEMDEATFLNLKANQNGAINNWLAGFGDADKRLGKFIVSANSAGEAVAQFNAQVANTTPIKAFFSNLGSGIVTLAGNFVSLMANMGLMLLATTVFSAIASGIYEITHATERAIEAGEKARDTIGEVRDDLKSQNDVIKEAKDNNFDDLMQGVDKKTNENISLTDEQYQQYLSTCNEIAEVYPEVVASYDAQGNAILNLGSSAETATEQLQGLLDRNKEVAGIKIADNLQAAYEGVKAEAEGLNGDGGIVAQIKEQEDAIKRSEKIISEAEIAYGGLSDDILDDVSKQLDGKSDILDLSSYDQAVYERIQDIVNAEGILDLSRPGSLYDGSHQLPIDPSKITEETLHNVA
jgi:hypothetical protein